MEPAMSMTEMLDIVVIPVVLLAIALMWPTIQNLHRRRTFMKLILRELEESGLPEESRSRGPHPPQSSSNGLPPPTCLYTTRQNQWFTT